MATSFSVYKTPTAGDTEAPLADGQTVSGATTYYSRMWTGKNADGYGLTVKCVGTMVGAFTLWMTDKYHPIETTDADWVEDTSFAPVDPAGADCKFRDDTSGAKAWRKRLKYVNASGSGTIYANVAVPQG